MNWKYLGWSAAVLLFACWNSVGFHQGDEHFQLLEFAGYKAGIIAASDLAWEFDEQMRPALQPGIAYLAYRAFGLFGEVNPYWLAFFLRVVSASLFLWIGSLIYRRYAPALPQNLLRWLALLLLFHWCTIYSGIRFSNENWSGLAFVLGLLTYPIPKPSSHARIFLSEKPGTNWASFTAGLLFGLSFLFRYQLAVAIIGFGAWLLFIGKERWWRLALVVLGGIVMISLGTLVDYWFYGDWVLAPWNYLRINVFEGVAATFGTRPWWGYFELIFERGVPPLSLFYLLVPFWFCYRYRRDPITWIFLAFFIVHSALSRKDLRFLFPLLPLLPVVLMAAATAAQSLWGKAYFQRRWVRRSLVFLVVINLLLLASVAVRPMTTEVLVNRYIYNHYSESVTLYADGKHAYSYANLVLHFYRRPGKVTIVDDERHNWPSCTTPVCLYSQQTKQPNPPEGAKLVYTNKPEFLNFGGWLEGKSWWYVYELE